MPNGSILWFAETDFIEKFAKKIANKIAKEDNED